MRWNDMGTMAVLCTVMMVMVGLGGGCPPVDDDVCDPGKTEECACLDGGQGVQECDDDGGGWGDCECGQGDDDDYTGDDDDEGVYLTVVNYTSYTFLGFQYKLCSAGENSWYMGCNGSIDPGYQCTTPELPLDCYDLWVWDVTNYGSEAFCDDLVAGQECIWEVYDSDMYPI